MAHSLRRGSRARDYQGRLGILDEVGDLRLAIGRVERHVHRSGPQAAEIQQDGGDGLVDLGQDSVTNPDPLITKPRLNTGGLHEHAPVGQRRCIVGFQEGLLLPAWGGARQDREGVRSTIRAASVV